MKKKCRILNSNLTKFLDLGKQPLANGFISKGKKSKREYFYNLSVGFSEKSSMVQIIQGPKKEKMFNNNYSFYSSTSKYMDYHFKEFSKEIKKFLKKKKIIKPVIVEIGSNDGIMLKRFKKYRHYGIEPASNVADVSKKLNLNVIKDFFNLKNANLIKNKYGKIDVYYSANVICHIENLNNVFDVISKTLSDKGVFIFEDPYLGSIIEKVSYDQIYDEHIFLFSCLSVSKIAELHGLDLFDMKPQITHGGSMRYYLCKKKQYKKTVALKNQVKMELKRKLNKIETFKKFAVKVNKSKKDLLRILKKIKKEKKTIYAYGATAKSTTVFNFCNINDKLIANYFDNTPIKQNKLSPGMHIPVYSFKKMKKYPDYFFLSAWNHSSEIFKKEKKFKNNGGKWITHVPKIQII
jgi:SAM-dependent methyltransferase